MLYDKIQHLIVHVCPQYIFPNIFIQLWTPHSIIKEYILGPLHSDVPIKDFTNFMINWCCLPNVG